VAEKEFEGIHKRIEYDRRRIDLVEVRADFLEPEELGRVDAYPGLVDVPLIFTLRRESDGGRWTASEDERNECLLRAATGGYRYLDLESDVAFGDVEAQCAEVGTTIIRSLHDFSGVPSKMTDVIEKLPHEPGEIPKVAVTPASTADLIEIVKACRNLEGVEKIILGMGPWGFATRILAAKLGSLLTFCSPAGLETAPGHIDPETLTATYRYASITDMTDVYCVIGNPVMHSRSPWIHNPGFDSIGIDAVYVPLQIDELDRFFELAELLDIKGASVTVPHKSAIRKHLVSEDESVGAVGSCNTVVRGKDGFQGANTDVFGFKAPLLDLFGGEGRLEGAKVTVIGAGGAARAVVHALKGLRAEVCVVNRTHQKAVALAREFGCEAAPLAPESVGTVREYSDLIVQTTSVGMHPHQDADPMPFYEFSGGEVVYDIVYTPPETLFLGRAKRAGCRTLNGERMLLEQAYLQFRLFTGFDYPAS
jgi:3-dehydroquinate dehydratase/shikimate dehydrogenase